MIKCKCTQKFRDKNNKIIGYRLEDSNGNRLDVTPENLKLHIYSGQLEVYNLKLTKDGRLIDQDIKAESNLDSEVLSIDNKELKEFTKNFGFIASDSDKIIRNITGPIADDIVKQINQALYLDIDKVRALDAEHIPTYCLGGNYFSFNTGTILSTTKEQEKHIKEYNDLYGTTYYANNKLDNDSFMLNLVKIFEYMVITNKGVLYNINQLIALLKDNLSTALYKCFNTFVIPEYFNINVGESKNGFIVVRMTYEGANKLDIEDKDVIRIFIDYRATSQDYILTFSTANRRGKDKRISYMRAYNATKIEPMEDMLRDIRQYTTQGLNYIVEHFK